VPAVEPAANAQVADDGVKVPVLFVVKLTVPVGLVGLDDTSVTVAVQFAAVPTVTALGAQETDVVVA
jgi:hypothetical protein